MSLNPSHRDFFYSTGGVIIGVLVYPWGVFFYFFCFFSLLFLVIISKEKDGEKRKKKTLEAYQNSGDNITGSKKIKSWWHKSNNIKEGHWQWLEWVTWAAKSKRTTHHLGLAHMSNFSHHWWPSLMLLDLSLCDLSNSTGSVIIEVLVWL
jgi:hypothetical protein